MRLPAVMWWALGAQLARHRRFIVRDGFHTCKRSPALNFAELKTITQGSRLWRRSNNLVAGKLDNISECKYTQGYPKILF